MLQRGCSVIFGDTGEDAPLTRTAPVEPITEYIERADIREMFGGAVEIRRETPKLGNIEQWQIEIQLRFASISVEFGQAFNAIATREALDRTCADAGACCRAERSRRDVGEVAIRE